MVVHRIALLVPLASLDVSGVSNNGWHLILQLRREEYRELASSEVQLVFGVHPFPIALLSSEHHVDTDDLTSGQVASGAAAT